MNQAIFYFFYNFAHQSNLFDGIVVFLAVYLPYIVIVLAGIFLLFHHEVFSSPNPIKEFMQKWKEIALVFFSGILAWVVAYGLKILVHTPRPFIALANVHSLFPESGYSFPSGHATFFMALAVAIFVVHKKAGYTFMFFALLIGIARIIGGVHFPVDIIGGFALGFLVSDLVAYIASKI